MQQVRQPMLDFELLKRQGEHMLTRCRIDRIHVEGA